MILAVVSSLGGHHLGRAGGSPATRFPGSDELS